MYKVEISNPYSKPPLKWNRAPDLPDFPADCQTIEDAHAVAQLWTARGYMVRISG